MKLYKLLRGVLLNDGQGHCLLDEEWDSLINRDNLFALRPGDRVDITIAPIGTLSNVVGYN